MSALVRAAAVALDFGVALGILRSGGTLATAHVTGAFAAAACLASFGVSSTPASTFGKRLVGMLGMALVAVIVRGGVIGVVHLQLGQSAVVALAAAAVGSAILVWLVQCAFSGRPGSSAHPGGMWRRSAALLFGFTVATHLLYAGVVELLPQEAYYWNYAQHPALGYLDHPPMIAWVIRLGTMTFGDSEFGVRAGPIALALLAAWWMVDLTRNLFGRSAAWGALMICGALPFVVAPGFFATPDAPLLAFWAGTLYYLEKAIIGEERRAWIGAGVCLGLGLLSKYTIVLLPAAALLWIVADRRSRVILRRPDPYLAMALALLIFSPVLAWNARHDWASFAFQGTRRMEQVGATSLPQLLGFALLLVTPAGLYLEFRSLLARAPDGAPDDRRARMFLAMVTLAPLAVFVIYATGHRTMRISWTIPIWLGAIPAMANRVEVLWSGGSHPGLIRVWKMTVVGSVVVIGLLLHVLTLGAPGFALRHSRQLPVAWTEISRQVDGISARIESESGRRPLVVDSGTYYIASPLAYYGRSTRDGVASTSGGNMLGFDGLMYGYWFSPEAWKGRTMIVVALDEFELRDARLRGRFGALTPIRRREISRDGQSIGHWSYRIGYDYRAPGG